MQNISHAPSVTTVPARPAVAAKAKAGTRLTYIDTIRMILTILVLMVHAAGTYIELGGWTYHDYTIPAGAFSEVLFSLFLLVCQSFFMGLFFFISGYFTPGSYDRKGPAPFWKDRLLRLGIPLVIYTFILSRIPNYINAIANEGVTVSIWQYSLQTFWGEADTGPTWFLFALLVFSLGYTLWRLISRWSRLDLAWASRLPAPGTLALLVMGLVFGAAMFAIAQVRAIVEPYELWETITLMVAFFPAYIILFTGGALAYRNQWLTKIPGTLLRFWGPFSAALIVTLPEFMILGGAIDGAVETFFGGLTWQCAGMCLWFGMACIAFSITLTLWMRERVQPQSRLAAYAGSNNFTVYLIHPAVLVPITYGLSFFALPVIVKFALASLLTVVACYLLADVLRRLPGARAIL